MGIYEDFSKIYDRFQTTDYGAFVRFYEEVFRREKTEPETVADLGCGSGNVSLLLKEAGYDVIGIDLSPDMLALAQRKAEDAGREILFLNMDMCSFELPNPVDCVISALDCINYLEDTEDVKRCFERVFENLKSGGTFIFDINSEYKLLEVLGNNTFVYEDDSAYCVWDCGCFPEEAVVSFELNFFVKEKDGRYSRYGEYQEETIFESADLAALLKETGFEQIKMFGDLTFEEPNDKSERIFFTARKR